MLDCVIVGMNEQAFDPYAKRQELLKDHSGSYEEILTNSIRMDGRYYTSIEFMNCLLGELTSSEWKLNLFETPNMGVFYLTCFLRKHHLDTELVNHYNTGKEKLFRWLAEGVRCIAITTTFYVTDEPVMEIIRDIRKLDQTVKIIVGGPRIYDIYTSYPKAKRDLALGRIGADYYIVDSQGESALCRLVGEIKRKEGREIPAAPNVIAVENGHVSDCVQVRENNSLDGNVMDWDLFDRKEYGNVVYMRTTRGCRYSCAYCTYPQFAGNYECCSLESVEREMDQLKQKGVKYIIFIDDSFNIPLQRLQAVCEMMLRKRYGFRWLSFFRCVKTDRDTVRLMKESGCIGVYLGVESLNRRVLLNMRKADIDYMTCSSLFAEAGILTLGSFIVGFPGETEETIRETVRMFRECPTTFYNPQLYYHSKMAPVNGRKDEFQLKGNGYSWSHGTMDWKEAVYWKNYMIRQVDNSILLPLYGSGIWALPYLFENGVTLDFFMDYSRRVSGCIRDYAAGGTGKTKEQTFRYFDGINLDGMNGAD